MSTAGSFTTDGHANALPPGTRLGEFEIHRVIGVGGFGIVYLAFDHGLEREVAIKEYMPSSLASRTATLHVSLTSPNNEETFKLGLRSFVNEAKLLARFDHRSLIKVHRFWEERGTAYMVMPLLRGRTLREARRVLGPPGEAWLRNVLDPVLGALEVLHREDVYHRDIAPDNILVGDDGVPMLLDFGAARHVIQGRSQTLTAILKPSYAPIEQYGEATNLRQGAWTDLYALGATFHYLITETPPQPATVRTISDDGRPLASVPRPGISERFLRTVDWMLMPRPADRPQSVAELREVLAGRAEVPSRLVLPPSATAWQRTEAQMADPPADFLSVTSSAKAPRTDPPPLPPTRSIPPAPTAAFPSSQPGFPPPPVPAGAPSLSPGFEPLLPRPGGTPSPAPARPTTVPPAPAEGLAAPPMPRTAVVRSSLSPPPAAGEEQAPAWAVEPDRVLPPQPGGLPQRSMAPLLIGGAGVAVAAGVLWWWLQRSPAPLPAAPPVAAASAPAVAAPPPLAAASEVIEPAVSASAPAGSGAPSAAPAPVAATLPVPAPSPPAAPAPAPSPAPAPAPGPATVAKAPPAPRPAAPAPAAAPAPSPMTVDSAALRPLPGSAPVAVSARPASAPVRATAAAATVERRPPVMPGPAGPEASGRPSDGGRSQDGALSATPPPRGGDPRDQCSGRMLLALHRCLVKECAKPQYYDHAECAQVRAIEERARARP